MLQIELRYSFEEAMEWKQLNMSDTLDITIDDSGRISSKQIDDFIERALSKIKIHSNLNGIYIHALILSAPYEVKNYIDEATFDSNILAYCIVQ